MREIRDIVRNDRASKLCRRELCSRYLVGGAIGGVRPRCQVELRDGNREYIQNRSLCAVTTKGTHAHAGRAAWQGEG